MSLGTAARRVMRPFVGLARRIDAKLFRRSVHLVQEVAQLRSEVSDLRSTLAVVIEQLDDIALVTRQGLSETRASYLALRGGTTDGTAERDSEA